MPNEAFIAQFGLRLERGVQPISGVFPESVRVQESINRPAVWTFMVNAQQTDVLNKSLRDLMQSPTPKIWVRIGSNIGGTANWGQWQEHLITRLRAVPKINTHTILLHTSDVLAEMDRETKTRAWNGEVSAIVE